MQDYRVAFGAKKIASLVFYLLVVVHLAVDYKSLRQKVCKRTNQSNYFFLFLSLYVKVYDITRFLLNLCRCHSASIIMLMVG